jgi:hypothetical protein
MPAARDVKRRRHVAEALTSRSSEVLSIAEIRGTKRPARPDQAAAC